MPKKKVFCFDLDNVICITTKNFYNKSKPNHKAIKIINKLHSEGHTIKIMTARYSGRFNDDFKKTKKIGYKKTLLQLKKWGVKFDRLYMTKPSFDFYVDDKSFNFNNSWTSFIEKKYLKR